MRKLPSVVVLVLALAGGAEAAEPPLAPSGFEAVDTHGPIFAGPDGALVKRIPEAPAAPGRPRVMTPGGVAPAPAELTALEVSRDPLLTLWVQTVDLSPVIVVETWLAPGPRESAPAAGAPGVWLRPGAEVAVLRRVDDRAEVEYGDEALTLRGWIPVASLGKTYAPAAVPAPPAATATRLPERAELLDAPDGHEIAVVRRELPGVPVTKLGPSRAGHVLVERLDRGARVIGWIAERRLRRAGPVSSGSRVSMLYGNAVGTPAGVVGIDVAAGTPVYDRPGGVVLGHYAARHTVYSVEQRDGHAMVSIQTTLGVVQVWVAWSAPVPTPR
jgi:hypothetical protein